MGRSWSWPRCRLDNPDETGARVDRPISSLPGCGPWARLVAHGRSLSGRIAAIRERASANMDDIEAARSDFDALQRDRS